MGNASSRLFVQPLVLQSHLGQKCGRMLQGGEADDHQRRDRASGQEERELSIIRQSAQALAELVVRIGSHFGRAEVRKRVGRYLHGLLAEVPRKNGWQMAEE